ncbi:25S rRNA (adenine2142-N1)-methyltransferase [Bulinus truncatus]|nr:25S rRNA (adenine2142-N1)-methyltransferase [Bulinus truncatus]
MSKECEDNIDLKTQHLHLASIIKGMHKHLRREYRANDQEIETVWQQHAEDEASLQLYASAMYQLATKHWSKYAETRIDWCQKAALEYFLNDGLEVALEKDRKRKYYAAVRTKAKADRVGESKEEPVCDGFQRLKQNELDLTETRYSSTTDELFEIDRPLSCKIRLLDVGSCYNPFYGLENFEVVGIDLSPATQTVLKCDFLRLETTKWPNPLTYDLTCLSSPITHLPQSSFHVVVFSLLLEYMPSSLQRWQCCVRAHELLTANGLLLIITPDSHSQHRNAPMMKSWKLALENLGFLRWKYEKKEHVHCMAFRKVEELILPCPSRSMQMPVVCLKCCTSHKISLMPVMMMFLNSQESSLKTTRLILYRQLVSYHFFLINYRSIYLMFYCCCHKELLIQLVPE